MSFTRTKPDYFKSLLLLCHSTGLCTVPKAHRKKKKILRGERIEGGGKQWYNIQAEHMYSYRYILEMVIYKTEIHGENMLYSRGGCYLELVLFDAFRVGTEPVSL